MSPRKLARWLAVAAGAAVRLIAGPDPLPSQPSDSINPPFRGSPLNAPFPDNFYGADHSGSSLALTYPFTGPFGYTDHSRGMIVYQCAPFTPRQSEGVYGIDVWLEQGDGAGNWSVAGEHGGLPDSAVSPYQPINTPTPGPSPSYHFQWTFAAAPLPAHAIFRVFIYVYIYNQGGGTQGNFFVPSSLGFVFTQAANDPPRLSWTPADGAINPEQVIAGQTYAISAAAEDDNGNLAAVSIWKNGQSFASTGGGDGWSTTVSGTTQDPPGPVIYTAQATDAAGLTSELLRWTVNVGEKSDQPAIASADATLPMGQPFTPVTSGGAGTGGWQFAVVGFTNWDGGVSAQAGTLTSNWFPSWFPPAAGTYSFWVARDGDGTYKPSALAGPYTLVVTGPPAQVPVTADDAAASTIAASIASAQASGAITNARPATPQTLPTEPGSNDGSLLPVVAVPLSGESAPRPTGVLVVSPLEGAAPLSATITWSTTQATTATVAGSGLISSALSGTQMVNLPTPGSYQYTLVAAGPGGTDVENFTIQVAAPPATPALAAIFRIRFDMTGKGFRMRDGEPGVGASTLWTDPAGLLRSPWPSLPSPPAAISGPAGVILPPVPVARP